MPVKQARLLLPVSETGPFPLPHPGFQRKPLPFPHPQPVRLQRQLPLGAPRPGFHKLPLPLPRVPSDPAPLPGAADTGAPEPHPDGPRGAKAREGVMRPFQAASQPGGPLWLQCPHPARGRQLRPHSDPPLGMLPRIVGAPISPLCGSGQHPGAGGGCSSRWGSSRGEKRPGYYQLFPRLRERSAEAFYPNLADRLQRGEGEGRGWLPQAPLSGIKGPSRGPDRVSAASCRTALQGWARKSAGRLCPVRLSSHCSDPVRGCWARVQGGPLGAQRWASGRGGQCSWAAGVDAGNLWNLQAAGASGQVGVLCTSWAPPLILTPFLRESEALSEPAGPPRATPWRPCSEPQGAPMPGGALGHWADSQ